MFLLWVATTITAQVDSLRMRLDSLLQDPMFETSQVALMVYDLTTDAPLYTHNHRQLMRPASVMKLVTAITALDLLGSGYDYQTRIYTTGTIEGTTLEGNIYCVGGFDPTMTLDDLTALAWGISRQGIDSIHGLLVADRSMKESLDYGEGWCWDDDNPVLTPLTLGRKNTFLQTFAEELARSGINLEGVRLAEGRVPKDARLVTTCSHNITKVLERMMKVSDNFYAESMFYQTAARAGRGLARAADARNATKRLISQVGLQADSYRIADGSGLSLYNYVSAELLCRLMRYAWRKSDIRTALLPSLPIAGVDGTLRDRMRRTAASGNVRAKTGTVTGISSLAGYCTSADGHQLCFAIINQSVLRTSPGRAFQDKVCAALCEAQLTMDN